MDNNRPKLTLIGTVHRDPQGLARLQALLEELQPDVISLEMSPYALRYRQTLARPQLLRLERILEKLAAETGQPKELLQQHPAVLDIYKLLDQPFEYRAAVAYADGCNCRLGLTDVSEVSARKLKKVGSGLITYRNLKILTSLPQEQQPAQQENYDIARTLLRENISASKCAEFLQQRRGTEGVGPRDQEMARQIEMLLTREGTRHLVHIGGWVHLVADPQGETLYSRLEAYAPVRRLLVEGNG